MVFDNEFPPRIDKLGDRLAEDVRALQALAQLGTWYGWPVVVSSRVEDEHAEAGRHARALLEWDGERWVDQPEPAFTANEDWEHGSVYEPNLIYHDRKWRMWYVAGSNQDDYLVHGYAESEDGRTGWSKHVMFAPPDMKMFDFCVRQRSSGFDAIFARVWMKDGTPPTETGLWWCRAEQPSGQLSGWGQPVQIMTAEDRGWHSGPWKPSLAFDEHNAERALLFFDGLYRTNAPGPFPFAFVLGCLEITLPLGSRDR